jgi:hypothetical protein
MMKLHFPARLTAASALLVLASPMWQASAQAMQGGPETAPLVC